MKFITIYLLCIYLPLMICAKRRTDNGLRCRESIYQINGTCTIVGYRTLTTEEFTLHRNYAKDEIVEVKFINSELSFTPDKIFIELEFVKTLDLSGCHVVTISNSTFTFGYNLQAVNLSRNLLTHLSASVFKGAVNLMYIDLSHNRISTIDEDAFKNYKNLLQIDLSYNYMTIVSPNTFPAHVSQLNLDFNRIADFSVSDLIKIDQISLNNNELVSLQLNTYTRSLSADNNYLRADNLIVNNTNLNSLSLKNNTITSLGAIATLSNLTYMDVSYNPINYTCADCRGFTNLKNLKTLILKSTNLNPTNFELLTELLGLETLDVSSNALSYIDFNLISRSENLQILNLRDNRLSKLTFNEFEYLFPRLHAIDISENDWMCSDLIAVLTKFKQLRIQHEIDNGSSINLFTNIRGIRCTNSTRPKIMLHEDSDLQIDGNAEFTKLLNQFQNDNEKLKMKLNEIWKRLEDNAEQPQQNLIAVDNQFMNDMKMLMEQFKDEMREEITPSNDPTDDDPIQLNQITELKMEIVTKIDRSFVQLYDIKIYVCVGVLLLINLFIIYVAVFVFRRFSGKNQDRYNNYNFPTIPCPKEAEATNLYQPV